MRRGQPLATLRNAALRARIATLGAEREAASHHLDQLRRGVRAEELAVARSRVEQARSEVQRATRNAELASSPAETLYVIPVSMRPAIPSVAAAIVSTAANEVADGGWSLRVP